MIRHKLQTTGIGVGGSGGVAVGRVKSVLFKENSHLLAFEAVSECAETMASFFDVELRRWCEEEDLFEKEWGQKSKAEKTTVNKEWLQIIASVGNIEGKFKSKV